MNRHSGLWSLSQVLLSHRIGIRLDRFAPKTNPRPYKILKGRNLGKETNALNLWATEGEIQSLEYSLAVKRRGRPTLDFHELKAGDVLVPLKFHELWAACIPPTITEWNRGDDGQIPCLAYGGLMVLTPNPDIVLPEYLTLWLRSEAAVNQTSKYEVEGKDFCVITIPDLLRFSIDLPPVSEQQSLVSDYCTLLNEKNWMGLSTKNQPRKLANKMSEFNAEEVVREICRNSDLAEDEADRLAGYIVSLLIHKRPGLSSRENWEEIVRRDALFGVQLYIRKKKQDLLVLEQRAQDEKTASRNSLQDRTIKKMMHYHKALHLLAGAIHTELGRIDDLYFEPSSAIESSCLGLIQELNQLKALLSVEEEPPEVD